MLKRLLLTIPILALLLAGLALPARAEPDVATYYKTLSAYDFTPNNSTIKFQGYGSEIYATQLDPGSAFSAQVNLPQGAQIVSVSYYLVDNTDHTSDISCGMRVYTPSNDSMSTVASANTGALAASPSVQTVTSTSGLPVTVDNSLNSYFLRVELTTTGVDQAIVGARIAYTLPLDPPASSQYLTAGGWAFRPISSNMKYEELGGNVWITTDAYSMHMVEHLDLPVGAQITDLVFYVYDNDAANNLSAGLDRTELNSSGLSVYSVTTSGASASISALTVPLGSPVTVEADYSYSLYFRIASGSAVSSNMHVAGARLTYTPPSRPFPLSYYTARVSGFNFWPSASAIGYSGMGGGQYQTASFSSYGLFAPLDLPQGAVLRGITCNVKDNDAANAVSCALKAFQPAANTSWYMTSASTAGKTPSTSMLTLSAPVNSGDAANPVNNGLYRYLLRVYYENATNSNLMVYGVVIDYGWPVYIPAVSK